MKKSILSVLLLIVVSMFATSAFAWTITNGTTWNLNCDTTSAQNIGDITFSQSFPGEATSYMGATALGTAGQIASLVASGLLPATAGSGDPYTGAIVVQYAAYSMPTASTWQALEANTFSLTGGTSAINYTGSWSWTDSANKLTVATTAVLPNALYVGDFDNTNAVMSSGEAFTVRSQRITATGNGGSNDGCVVTSCEVTASVYVLYVNEPAVTSMDNNNCRYQWTGASSLLVATSLPQPDLCSTTLKYPYIVNNQDDNGYFTALVVTSNMSTTCLDVDYDTVDFYAWDEGGNYRGARGPYTLNPSGQVLIVVSDPDDGGANDMGATADAIKHSTFSNSWWDLAAGTWNPWLNGDGAVKGRGQVIAIVNQNYAEGYQFLFSISAGVVNGFGTTLAIKDLTNYVGIQDETRFIAAVRAYEAGYVTGYNLGITGINNLGSRVRGVAGISEGYVH